MARRALLGNKVRRLRREHQLSQVDLARRLGISASYLNLIEHNQRPLTLPLLLKLAEKFEVDLQAFSQDEGTRLLAELTELFGDSLFGELEVPRDELKELVEIAPGACRALIALYRAYRGAREDVRALGERLSDTSFLSTSTHELRTLLTSIRSYAEILSDYEDIESAERQRFTGHLVEESARLSGVIDRMLAFAIEEDAAQGSGGLAPLEEVADFFQEHDNHFAPLEEAADELRRELGLGDGDNAARLAEALQARYRVAVTVVGTATNGTLGEADSGRLELRLSEVEPLETRRFRMARELARRACGSLVAELLGSAAFSTAAAVERGRDALASYVAGALLLPYEPFLEAAQALRYDVERLQRRFEASYEQVCHRLCTLQRVGATGVPFHLLRVDIAGNLSKRFSASGLRIARYGGVCPRWAVHAAFLTPGRFVSQVSRLPDGDGFFDVARTVTKTGAGPYEPRSHFAISLGCDLSRAAELVYADAVDLDSTVVEVPVGVTCRLCERLDCKQRAHAPILPSLASA